MLAMGRIRWMRLLVLTCLGAEELERLAGSGNWPDRTDGIPLTVVAHHGTERLPLPGWVGTRT
jgi:hypothetical protein